MFGDNEGVPRSKFFSDSPESMLEATMHLSPETFRAAIPDPDEPSEFWDNHVFILIN